MIPVEHRRGATEETSVLSELIACSHAEVQKFLRSASSDISRQLHSIIINHGPDYLWSIISAMTLNASYGRYIDPQILLTYLSDNLYGSVDPESVEFDMLASFPSCSDAVQDDDGRMFHSMRMIGSEARIIADRVVLDVRSDEKDFDGTKRVPVQNPVQVAAVSEGYRKLLHCPDPIVRGGILYVLPSRMLGFVTRTKKLDEFPMAWLRPRLYLMIREALDSIRVSFPEAKTMREELSMGIDEMAKRTEGVQKIW